MINHIFLHVLKDVTPKKIFFEVKFAPTYLRSENKRTPKSGFAPNFIFYGTIAQNDPYTIGKKIKKICGGYFFRLAEIVKNVFSECHFPAF